MKKYFLSLFVISFLNSCGIYLEQIAQVNMISKRNVDLSKEYVEIRRNAGSNENELKASYASNIEEAITNLVKTIPGGEFIMNAKIYRVDNWKKLESFYAIEGDVWGLPGYTQTETPLYGNFKMGDKVMYKKGVKYRYGKIIASKNQEFCVIEDEENKKMVTKKFSKLMTISEEE